MGRIKQWKNDEGGESQQFTPNENRASKKPEEYENNKTVGNKTTPAAHFTLNLIYILFQPPRAMLNGREMSLFLSQNTIRTIQYPFPP